MVGGQVKFYPYKISDLLFSHFVAPPPFPVINDQTLRKLFKVRQFFYLGPSFNSMIKNKQLRTKYKI